MSEKWVWCNSCHSERTSWNEALLWGNLVHVESRDQCQPGIQGTFSNRCFSFFLSPSPLPLHCNLEAILMDAPSPLLPQLCVHVRGLFRLLPRRRGNNFLVRGFCFADWAKSVWTLDGMAAGSGWNPAQQEVTGRQRVRQQPFCFTSNMNFHTLSCFLLFWVFFNVSSWVFYSQYSILGVECF